MKNEGVYEQDLLGIVEAGIPGKPLGGLMPVEPSTSVDGGHWEAEVQDLPPRQPELGLFNKQLMFWPRQLHSPPSYGDGT